MQRIFGLPILAAHNERGRVHDQGSCSVDRIAHRLAEGKRLGQNALRFLELSLAKEHPGIADQEPRPVGRRRVVLLGQRALEPALSCYEQHLLPRRAYRRSSPVSTMMLANLSKE